MWRILYTGMKKFLAGGSAIFVLGRPVGQHLIIGGWVIILRVMTPITERVLGAGHLPNYL